MFSPTLEFLKAHVRDWRLYAAVGLFVLAITYSTVAKPPENFPTGSIITLRSGATLSELSHTLATRQVVRSAFVFRLVAMLEGGEKHVQAGDYALPGQENVFSIAWRMLHGEHGLDLVKVFIPEGYTVREISALFDAKFPLFSPAEFRTLAPEGYMFPDTYFIQTNATASSTIAFFQDNFKAKTDPLMPLVSASGHTLEEGVIMASILEKEVQGDDDRRLVAGILWKRIKLGMPLQVDSAPITYKKKGLPPAPISNPGIEAITAALAPTNSKYLYFLTDKKGVVHYAVTLAEHDANIDKYL